MTTVDGIPDFESAFKNKDVSTISGLRINFISDSDLIANKKATNRLQDQLDIQRLTEVNKKRKI